MVESHFNAEIMRIPMNDILALKQENGLADKDLATLTMPEKVRSLYFEFRFFVLSRFPFLLLFSLELVISGCGHADTRLSFFLPSFSPRPTYSGSADNNKYIGTS